MNTYINFLFFDFHLVIMNILITLILHDQVILNIIDQVILIFTVIFSYLRLIYLLEKHHCSSIRIRYA